MKNMNLVFFSGNLGADVKLRHFDSGRSVCTFPVASSYYWKDKNGQSVKRSEWMEVEVWGKLAQEAQSNLKKGDFVHVIGTLRTKRYTNKEGNEVKRVVLQGDGLGYGPDTSPIESPDNKIHQDKQKQTDQVSQAANNVDNFDYSQASMI